MDEPIKLQDGKLLLFKRNGIWQARIYTGERRYLWRSLKTSSRTDARQAGLRLLHETEYKLVEGLPVHQRTFGSVIDEYVDWRKRDCELGIQAGQGASRRYTTPAMLRQVQRVVRFWREYAGSKVIEAVDDKLLAGYVQWRQQYYHHMAQLPKNAKLNPTDKTLQWEIMLGKALIKFAHDKGYRGNKPLPTFTYVPKVKRVRPAFTRDEYTHLYRSMRRWIRDTHVPAWRYTRQLLRDYVLTLSNSGIRVGEANNLRWRDVVPFKDAHGRANVQLHVQGKTGSRVVIPRVAVKHYLERTRALRGDVKQGDWVFAMVDGRQVITLADQFAALLKWCGMERNSSGEKFTLYSLRHFYAVMAISGDIDIYTIARNMGTSVQVIESYYGKHATPAMQAARLGGKVKPAAAAG